MGFWREHTPPKFQIPTCCDGACVRRTNGEFAPERQAYQGAKGRWQQFFAALEQVLARMD
jgi:hypothetical protein